VDELPDSLKISNPQVLEQAEQMRADLIQRANSPFARMSPQEQTRARAFKISEELQNDLDIISEQIARGEATHELKAAQFTIASQLAEQLAITGNYERAYEIDPREEYRAEYRGILEAINRDDEESCGCPPGRTFVKADVFSLKHGRTVTLIKCQCGYLNARPITAELSKQREHRAKAQSLVGDLSPADAAERLRAIGHTTKQLS